jgi:hypothetical protein
MGTVGYAALMVEVTLLNRRQVAALSEQLAVQREDLAHQKAALAEQQEPSKVQLKQAEEAGDATRRTYVESIYARYDTTSPQVSIAIQGSHVFRQASLTDGSQATTDPQFFDEDELLSRA